MQPVIHYVAGLPRSGSTLLVNLLGQNPAHHVTPTNGFISMVSAARDVWATNEGFRAQGIQNVQPRVAAAIRGMSYGFYERELSDGKVVFDKNRGWPAQIELMEQVYRRPVRVICTVRDVKSVAASFEKMHRNNPLLRRKHLGPAYFQATTIDGRAQVLTSPAGIIGHPANMLRDALNRGVSDRLIIVPFHLLTTSPKETLDYIHRRLGMEPWDGYDPDNVQQITQEDDAVYGWGYDLHKIRSKVEPATEAAWDGVLPPHTCRWIDQQFADLNYLAETVPDAF